MKLIFRLKNIISGEDEGNNESFPSPRKDKTIN